MRPPVSSGPKGSQFVISVFRHLERSISVVVAAVFTQNFNSKFMNNEPGRRRVVFELNPRLAESFRQTRSAGGGGADSAPHPMPNPRTIDRSEAPVEGCQ